MGDESADVRGRVKSELCEEWLQYRVDSWGPAKGDDSIPPSWAGSITTKLESAFHYITCNGQVDGKSCSGVWSRKRRRAVQIDLHCVYGGWVIFDGRTATSLPLLDADDDAGSRGSKLRRLRRRWAEHVLSRTVQTQAPNRYSDGIWVTE